MPSEPLAHEYEKQEAMTMKYPALPEYFSFLDMLDEKEQELLSSSSTRRVFKRHSYIYWPGDEATCIYFLVKGSVKIATHWEGGKEVIKHLVQPKAIFGEMALVEQKKRIDFAQVLKEEVALFEVPVATVRQLMSTNHGFSHFMMGWFGRRLAQVENRIESLIFKDARTRIVEFIKEAARKRGKKVGYETLLSHPLTHQDIANLTSTSRQTVTLVLNELKKMNLIYFNRGKILIRDMAKLM